MFDAGGNDRLPVAEISNQHQQLPVAYLAPSDLPQLALSGGRNAELSTLDRLRRELSENYTVFHGVHWSREWRSVPAFGDADFIIVNGAGNTLTIEQKSGTLTEADGELLKTYDGQQKNVLRQIHRTLDGIRDKYRRNHNGDIALDYLLYCPDHRLRTLNSVGLDRSRIVDAAGAGDLPSRIMSIIPPAGPTEIGNRVRRFFEQSFDLVPDIHAHVSASERALVRLSDGLAKTVGSIEMSPMRLRVRGTAGCGKSAVAARAYESALQRGNRPLLVCFNRPLAEVRRGNPESARFIDS